MAFTTSGGFGATYSGAWTLTQLLQNCCAPRMWQEEPLEKARIGPQ